jgi:hypothetical protein
MEMTLAAEITHAAWRLRRCAALEAGMAGSETQLDPMVDSSSAPTQATVDRAHAQALRNLQRATAELRRLQTERQVRVETLPADFDTTGLGLGSYKDMAPVLRSDLRRQLLLHQLGRSEMLSAVTEAIHRPVPAAPAKQTQFAAAQPIARSACCPCGSGLKYKRCCGTNAPAVLSSAA